MQQVTKFQANDGQMFDTAGEALTHESILAATAVFREFYEVSLKTQRSEALATAILGDPQGIRDMLAILDKPVPVEDGVQRGTDGRRIRTDDEVISDISGFLTTKGPSSMTAVYKGIGASLLRVKKLLENTKTKFEFVGGRWSVVS